MPVCVPSRRGSMRMVATTRTLPPGAGWTFTSPNGSTTRFSCAMSQTPSGVNGRRQPADAGRLPGFVSIVLVLLDADIGRGLAGRAELQREGLPLVGAFLFS